MVVPKSGGGTKTTSKSTTKKATTSKSSTTAKKPTAGTSSRKNDAALKKRLKTLLDKDSGSSSKGNLDQKEFEEIRDLLSTSDVQQFILNTAKKENKAGTSKSTKSSSTPFKKVDKNKNSTAKTSTAKKRTDCPDGSCPLVRKSTTTAKKPSSCPDGSCPLVKKTTTAAKKTTGTKRKATTTTTTTKKATAAKKPRKAATTAKKTTGKSSGRKACGPCGSKCGCSSRSGGGCGCDDDDSYSDDSEDDDDDSEGSDESDFCSSCDYSDTDTDEDSDDSGCNGGACGRPQKPTNGKAKGGNNKNNRYSSGSWETESDSNCGYSNSNGRRRDGWQIENLDSPIDTSGNLNESTWHWKDVIKRGKLPCLYEFKTETVKPLEKLEKNSKKVAKDISTKIQKSQPFDTRKNVTNSQIGSAKDIPAKTARKADKNLENQKQVKKAEALTKQVPNDKKISKTGQQDKHDKEPMDDKQNEITDKTMKKKKEKDKTSASSAEIDKKEIKLKDEEKAAKQKESSKLNDKKSKKSKKVKEGIEIAPKDNARKDRKSKTVKQQTEENNEKMKIEAKNAKQKFKGSQKQNENDNHKIFDFGNSDSSDETYELGEEEESEIYDNNASWSSFEEHSPCFDDKTPFGVPSNDEIKYLNSKHNANEVSHKQVPEDRKVSKTKQQGKNDQKPMDCIENENGDKSMKKKEKSVKVEGKSAKVIKREDNFQGKEKEITQRKPSKISDKKSKKNKKAEKVIEKPAKESSTLQKETKTKTVQKQAEEGKEKTKIETKKEKQKLKNPKKDENTALIPFGKPESHTSEIVNDFTVSCADETFDYWSTDSSDETYELEEEESDSHGSWSTVEEFSSCSSFDDEICFENPSDDNLDSEIDENGDSSADDDYHLPEGVEEDVLVRRGEAKMYDATEDIDFDSDASSAQIFELSNDESDSVFIKKKSPTGSQKDVNKRSAVEDSKKTKQTQLKRATASKRTSTAEGNSNEDSDDSCPQLVPLELNYSQEEVEFMEYSTDESYTSSMSSESDQDELPTLEPAIIKAGQSLDSETSYLDINSLLQDHNDFKMENDFKHPLNILMSKPNLNSRFEVISVSTPQPVSAKSKSKLKKRKLENVTLNEAESSFNFSINPVETKDSGDITFSNESQGALDSSCETTAMPEFIRPKFYNSLSTYQVLLHLRTDIYIHGTLKVKLLAGSVNILGYDLKLGETVEIFSPRGNNLLSLSPIDSKKASISKEKLLKVLSGLNKDFVETDFKEISKEYDCQKHAILLLERNDHSKRVSMVRKYMKEDIFHRSNSNQPSPYSQSQFLLRCGFFTQCSNSIRIDASWNFVQLSEKSKLLVVGGKGVGKSTFVRYTINNNLPKLKQFLLIDLDIGQPEAFVPQTISATVISEPILGPGYFYGLTPAKAYLFGDINVVIAPHSYLTCMKELFKYCHSENRFKNIPWIINTMGYTQGFGAELMSIIVECLQPTDVVQLQSVKQYANFEFPMNAKNVRQVPRNIYIDEPRHDVFDYSLHVIESIVTFEKSDKMQKWRMSPQEVRLAMVIAMLGGLLSEKEEWLTDVKPYRVSVDKINIVCPGDHTLTKQDLLDVINANIVYLCDYSNSAMECYGIGIVRGVDKYQQAIYLLPSVPPQTLVKVKTLVICQIPLPASILLNQGPKIKGVVPYTYDTNDFIASKHVPRRVYRTKNFQQVNKVLLDE